MNKYDLWFLRRKGYTKERISELIEQELKEFRKNGGTTWKGRKYKRI